MADDPSVSGSILVEDDQEFKEPDEYRVLLINDNYTTMDFVVELLRTVFHKRIEEATRIMMSVHVEGRGVVGTYTYDIAVTKINQAHAMARQHGYPLRCTMEKA
jgi:ATP-dependent Clp protease adaptor protein ClpS